MKKLILFTALLFSLTGFNNANKTFDGDHFLFNYPDDWTITDSEALEEDSFYLSVEKNGFDSSGIVTITSFDYLIDLDASIEGYIEEFHIRTAKFKEIVDNTFNGIESRSSKYSFNIFGFKHEGEIHAFSLKNRSYIVLKQEALEDKKANKKGFELITNSFSVK